MKLQSPRLIGFGIHDKTSYDSACRYSHGAIVGSAFIRALNSEYSIKDNIQSFISRLRK
jgi:tryptophan synthase alpha chain